MSALRRFAVHACDEGRATACTVEGASFEDAASGYMEVWLPALDADGDVRLIVTDCETGLECCLTFAIDTGETQACG